MAKQHAGRETTQASIPELSAAYDQAEVDPLADIAASVLEHINHDHADALVLLARHVGQCPADSATMTAVDHLGFHLRIEHQGARQDLRLPFPQAVHSQNFSI